MKNSAFRSTLAHSLLAFGLVSATQQVSAQIVFPTPGTTYNVTSYLDNIEADGEITLREAMTAIATGGPSGDAPFGEGPYRIELEILGDYLSLNEPLPGIAGQSIEFVGIPKDTSQISIEFNQKSGLFFQDCPLLIFKDLAIYGTYSADPKTPQYGGALAVNGVDVETELDLINCIFGNHLIETSITGETGGAAVGFRGRNLQIFNSQFHDNRVKTADIEVGSGFSLVGGAVAVASASLVKISHSKFHDNGLQNFYPRPSTYADGSALAIVNTNVTEIDNTEFYNNSIFNITEPGKGQIYVPGALGTHSFTRVYIRDGYGDNQAAHNHGLYVNARTIIAQSTIHRNGGIAAGVGGVEIGNSGTLDLVNTVIADNMGYGLKLSRPLAYHINHNTITGNTVGLSIEDDKFFSGTVQYNIIAENTTDIQVAEPGLHPAEFKYNFIGVENKDCPQTTAEFAGDFESLIGTVDLPIYPMLLPIDYYRFNTSDSAYPWPYRPLSPCSPAIDFGEEESLVTTRDISNFDRTLGGQIDIGASESPLGFGSQKVLHVNQTSTEFDSRGTTWDTAINVGPHGLAEAVRYFKEIQDICGEKWVQEIWVAEGTYNPLPYTLPDDSNNKHIAIELPSYIGIYGGFGSGSETSVEDRQAGEYTTVVSGDINDPNEVDDNSNRIFLIYSQFGITLDSLVIADGNTASGGGRRGVKPAQPYSDSGAGLAIIGDSSIIEIVNVEFRNNFATGVGAGLMMVDSATDVVIQGSRFVDNIVSMIEQEGEKGSFLGGRGGAIFQNSGTLVIIESDFDDNRADSGGAIFSTYSTIDLVACKFRENHAAFSGGAVTINHTSAGVIYCEFDDNSSGGYDGGAIYGDNFEHLFIWQSQFKNNRAYEWGGAIGTYAGGDFVIENSHFLNNTSETFPNGGAISSYSRGGEVEGEGEGPAFALAGTSTKGLIQYQSIIKNCIFDGNVAVGNIAAKDGASTLSNSGRVIQKGGPSSSGGAIYNSSDLPLDIINCTLVNNRAEVGGALAGTFRLYNSILLGNRNGFGDPDDFIGNALDFSNLLLNSISGSNIDSSYESDALVEDVLISYPLQGVDVYFPIPSGLAEDAGDDRYTTDTLSDYRGEAYVRIAGLRVDLGAIETADYDGDGVVDIYEHLVPSASFSPLHPLSGDGNGDGTLDGDQANVTAVRNAITSTYVTVATDIGVLSNLTSTDDPSDGALSQTDLDKFPVGFVGFTISGINNGDLATVDLHYETPLPVGILGYHKWGPRTLVPQDTLFGFPYTGTTSAGGEFVDETTTRQHFRLRLIDGVDGDVDNIGVQDGIIVDPGGPGDEAPLAITLDSFTATAAGVGSTVLIEWETAQEINNLGFNIHRAVPRANGKGYDVGEKLNSALIEATAIPGSGDSYSFVDTLPIASDDEVRGYILIDIDFGGVSHRNGPAFTLIGDKTSVSDWMFYTAD